VHPQIAWAKLEALAQGAALATRSYGVEPAHPSHVLIRPIPVGLRR